MLIDKADYEALRARAERLRWAIVMTEGRDGPDAEQGWELEPGDLADDLRDRDAAGEGV